MFSASQTIPYPNKIEEFKEGLELKEGLKPKRLPGGIVLVDKGYKMTAKKLRKLKED